MSRIVDPRSLAESISGLISGKKQISKLYVDLTIGKLYRVKTGGHLDFGGSEFEAGALEPCMPVKKEPEDSYGWWELHEGYFLIEYNEHFRLPENRIAIVQPHSHLLASGCSHITLTTPVIDNDFRVPLWIPKIGIHIKENARVSSAMILEF